MIGQVTLKNGQKIVEPISGSIPTGNPVGTLLSRANGQVPRNYLECDGSTFNASQYPALYLYLGTNVLPERFDHTKLGDIESITISTSSSSPTTIEYDGFLFITTPYNVGFTIYINGTGFSSNVNAVPTYCYPVKKGDNVYVTASCTCRIRYYKSHLYIKAVDGVDISDEDTFLDTVKNFIEEKNSYTTTEMLTGGKWIDGKPIYRRVYDGLNFGGTANNWVNTGATTTGVDRLINATVMRYDSVNDMNAVISLINIRVQISTGNIQYYTTTTAPMCDKIIIEYTKTTD